MTGRGRQGLTLIEVLVSMTVLAIILVVGLSFMSSQTRVFAASVERTTALTRGRYVAQSLQRDLRTLGSNLVSGQPGLVYAGSNVISFNADFVSNVAGDYFAVFVDVDAPAGQVTAPAAGFTVPGTAFTYGDTVHLSAAGTRSPAEHIAYFFQPDTTTTTADDFVLYRQVNASPPEVVTPGVRRLGGSPFFQYWIAAPEESAGGLFRPLADSALPIAHTAPFHLAPADTGGSATVDSVRAVSLRFSVWPSEDTTVVRPLSFDRMMALPNAGVRPVQSCGSRPILGTSLVLAAVAGTNAAGDPVVELSWPAATDDGGGEADVIRYVVWRRVLPTVTWGDPFLSLPAGSAPYSYTDAAVTSGSTYEYAVAAQDCTPSLSAMRASGVVIVP